MDTVIIALLALSFLGMGIFGLLAPAALVRQFGIRLGGVDGETEVRAVYGGFGVAVAVLLGFAAAGAAALRPGAVIAVGVALLGMAAGRVLARIVGRPSGFYPSWFYFWVETVGGGLLLFAA